MDTQEWFTQALEGDRVIVRLHIATHASGFWTIATAWCAWYDDMAPNGAMFVYEHGENDRAGMRPLARSNLGPTADWGSYFLRTVLAGPREWAEPQHVVCTIGPERRVGRVVPPTHPLVRTHLAAFWGLANAPGDVGPHWQVSYGIVARRLGGLVMSSAHAASRMIEVL